MNNPIVSVLIPVYNVEQYIARCLDSVLNQTYSNLEVIVVNDCTPDNSMAIVNEYAKKDSRIRIIEHDHNYGLMRARQTAYAVAKGCYIAFCDSDDTMKLYAVEELLNEAIASDADVVSADFEYVPVVGKVRLVNQSLKYGSDPQSVYKSLLLNEYAHNLFAKLFKREILQEYEYVTYGEDGYLFYQVVKNAKKVLHIKKSVYNYYQNLNSSSQKRLTEGGIRSILLFFQMLHERLMPKYPELNKVFSQYISKDLVQVLYKQGYNKELPIDAMLEKLFLLDFVSYRNMLSLFGLKGFLNLWAKKNIYHLVEPFLRLVR